MYSFGDRSIFQIDANLGAPAAMLEMLLYARPGVIELLPALPSAWKTGSVTGIGARGGFSVDLAWKDGKVTSATVRSVGGTETEVRFGRWKKRITLRRGQSVTLRP
ncbi:glycoside hydrolase family 95-like protein [Lentzea californiensis]